MFAYIGQRTEHETLFIQLPLFRAVQTYLPSPPPPPKKEWQICTIASFDYNYKYSFRFSTPIKRPPSGKIISGRLKGG